MATEK